MARRAASGKIDPDLKKAIKEELKGIHEKEGDKYKMPLMDRMRIYAVALKLAAIEAKVDDTELGTGFGEED